MTVATTIYLVSHFAPGEIGHGGVHRSYQIRHDARALAGKAHLVEINLESWRTARRTDELRQARDSHAAMREVRRRGERLGKRIASFRENPFKILRMPRYATAIPFSTTAW